VILNSNFLKSLIFYDNSNGNLPFLCFILGSKMDILLSTFSFDIEYDYSLSLKIKLYKYNKCRLQKAVLNGFQRVLSNKKTLKE